jgi:hypothetical protein
VNNRVLAGKIIDKDLEKRFLNLNVEGLRYIKFAGKSRVDELTLIIFDKSMIRMAKIADLFSDSDELVISDVEREILIAIEENNTEKIDIIII